MKEIKVTVQEDGQVVIETKGFTGQSCKDATAALEKVLGSKSSDVLTREGQVTNHGVDKLTHRG